MNCASIPTSLFEAQLFGYRRGAFTGATTDFSGFVRTAEQGTLFLDEVGELPPEVQSKLLRFLDQGEVPVLGQNLPARADVRIVAATNRDLASAVASGAFRPDLFARLTVWQTEIPPLRERAEDIVLLACRRLEESGLTCTVQAAEALALHRWPYNVRELLSLMDRIALSRPPDGVVRFGHLPAEVRGEATDPARKAGSRQRTTAPSPETLSRLLRETGYNIAEVARRLGVARQQVYRWLERTGLKPRQE